VCARTSTHKHAQAYVFKEQISQVNPNPRLTHNFAPSLGNAVYQGWVKKSQHKNIGFG